MTDYNLGDAEDLQHRRGDFACERPVVLKMDVLCSEQKRRASQRLRNCRNRQEWRREEHLAVARQRRRIGVEVGPQSRDEGSTLERSDIHFPISSEQFLAHFFSTPSVVRGPITFGRVLRRRSNTLARRYPKL